MKKMTLKDYYMGLKRSKPPKQSFVETVAKLCGVTEVCVRNWIYGSFKPREEKHIKILEEITGIKREDLWK